MTRFIVGLDLGQAGDYTALAVLEKVWVEREGQPRARYDVGHLERPPLGTPYPDVVALVRGRVAALLARGAAATLVVDQTGVGRPVVDLLRRAGVGCPLVPVTITAGHAATEVAGERSWERAFHVPKRELVSTLAVLLQTGRLRVAAGLPAAAILIQELLAFRARVTAAGHDAYGAGGDWREGAHDDLVLAVALAAWYGEAAPEPPIGVIAQAVARPRTAAGGPPWRRVR